MKKKKSESKRSYLQILLANKFRLAAYLSALLLFLFIPSQGYYETVQLEPHEATVRASSLEIEYAPYPRQSNGAIQPFLTARAVVAVDEESAVPLLEMNPEHQLRPASLTKLMTALVALEYYSLDDVLTVRRLAPVKDEADMGLAVGDQLTVRNLLYGLLVPSGNDAAYTLADNYPGGIENFIYAMNQKAADLSLRGTRFVNPSGLDAEGHVSTARDMAILAREAMKQEFISQVVITKNINLTDKSGKKTYILKNVNQLLGTVLGVNGVKTGYTELAGQCLITSVTRDGHTIIIALLGSSDRFGESARLVEWIFANYTWEQFTLAN